MYIYTREKRFGKNDIDLFLNGLFSCITKIRGILGAGSEINMILHHIIFEKITDDYFFENFQIILLMFGFIAKRNIKIVFGMNKIVKKPFFCST